MTRDLVINNILGNYIDRKELRSASYFPLLMKFLDRLYFHVVQKVHLSKIFMGKPGTDLVSYYAKRGDEVTGTLRLRFYEGESDLEIYVQCGDAVYYIDVLPKDWDKEFPNTLHLINHLILATPE